MILVNLLPAEQRKRIGRGPAFLQDKRFIAGFAVVFSLLTLVFYVRYQINLGELKVLKDQWFLIEKDVQRVTELKKKMEEGIKKEREFLERYVTTSFPNTAILTAASVFLPDSIWLLELKVTRQAGENSFLLKGLSLPNPRRSSIEDIEKYLRVLREKFPEKTELILTTSRQLKDNRELTLFTAVFKWP